MGRYYYGDIEGKFWFAVQSSDAASRFSKSAECEPSSIDYWFDEDNLNEVQKELKNIEDKLGDSLEKFNKFFESIEGYNSHMLIEAGLPVNMLEDYADYLLGKKIEKCIVDTGQCSFNAEL
jgi:hypothetical protein